MDGWMDGMYAKHQPLSWYYLAGCCTWTGKKRLQTVLRWMTAGGTTLAWRGGIQMVTGGFISMEALLMVGRVCPWVAPYQVQQYQSNQSNVSTQKSVSYSYTFSSLNWSGFELYYDELFFGLCNLCRRWCSGAGTGSGSERRGLQPSWVLCWFSQPAQYLELCPLTTAGTSVLNKPFVPFHIYLAFICNL